MNRASSCRTSIRAVLGRGSNPLSRAAWPIALAALTLTACGGDDDDSSSSTTTTTLAVAGTTTVAPSVTTTVAPTIAPTTTTPTAEFVTEGASVIVANSSGINGAAGRLTDQLAQAGFTMGDATNGTEGQLSVSKIYFDPSNDKAQAVAESVRTALGGGDIQLFEMGVPAPVDSGDVGDASVVVAMGNDIADKTLDQLQGTGAATTTTTTTGG